MTQATATEASIAAAPVFGHQPFSGTYRTRLEANGRIALPAAFKVAFSDSAMVRPRRSEHIQMWTPRGFDAVVDALQAHNADGMLDPQTRQRMYKATPRVSVDRQSRLVLPPEMRERVGLRVEAEVVVTGAIECLEIWPAQRFDNAEADRLDEVDLLFDTYSGLPTGPA